MTYAWSKPTAVGACIKRQNAWRHLECLQLNSCLTYHQRNKDTKMWFISTFKFVRILDCHLHSVGSWSSLTFTGIRKYNGGTKIWIVWFTARQQSYMQREDGLKPLLITLRVYSSSQVWKENKISRVIGIFESKKININLFSVPMRYDLSDSLLYMYIQIGLLTVDTLVR